MQHVQFFERKTQDLPEEYSRAKDLWRLSAKPFEVIDVVAVVVAVEVVVVDRRCWPPSYAYPLSGSKPAVLRPSNCGTTRCTFENCRQQRRTLDDEREQ